MTIETGADNSFDPKSWGDRGTAPSPAAPAPPVRAAATRAPRDTKLIAAFGASALILTSGLGLALAMKQPPRPAASVSVAASAPPPRESATASKRTLNLASPAALREALVANSLSAAEADAVTKAALGVLGGAAGEVRAVMSIEGSGSAAHLTRLEASFLDSSGVVVSRGADGQFSASRVAASLSEQLQVVRGEIDGDSFYSSAVAAGVTDSLIPDFAKAFVYDFNFQTEISAGDVFEAAFEQTVNANKQAVGAPHLVYASLTTANKSRSLYRFQPVGGDVGWFDGNGRSIVRSFMRTPVDGARVTSKFGMRFHPVLHYTRLHGGTDFAAPIGTPIFAAANGVVTTASPSSCAGNMVIVKHDNGWETRYFHLVRYADGVVPGLRVNQGFTIGFVGTTGVCTTGPHLHYEVHINGEKVDPQGIQTEEGRALGGDELKAFLKERDRIDVARARYAG